MPPPAVRRLPFVVLAGILALGGLIVLATAALYLLDADRYLDFYAGRDPPLGNHARFITHVAAGAVATIVGPLQFVERLRRVAKGSLHRAIGWTYVLSVVTGMAAAMSIAPYTYGGPINALALSLLALTWGATTGIGLFHGIARHVVLHHFWMRMSFAVTLAGASLRLQMAILNQLPGMSFETAYGFVVWSCWLPNVVAAWLIPMSRVGCASPRTSPTWPQ